MKVFELKELCVELNLSSDGRKADLIEVVCAALKISKSGSVEVDVKPYAASAFDCNTEQQYLSLGQLSKIEGEWCKDLSSVPTSFGMDRVTTYLIQSPDKTFDQKSVRAFKSLRAYSHMEGGHVVMFRVNKFESSPIFMFIRAYCKPSQATTHVYPVHVCLDKRTGIIYGAECRCVAGLGECCSHVAAVCFQLDDFVSRGLKSVPDDVSCTEKSCQWIAPANISKVQPQQLTEVHVYKPVLGKRKPSRPRISLEEFHPVPESLLKPTPERAHELAAKLRRSSAPNCSFATMYDASQCIPPPTESAMPPLCSKLPDTVVDFDLAPCREKIVKTTASASATFSSPQEASVCGYVSLRELAMTTPECQSDPAKFVTAFKSRTPPKLVEHETRGQSVNYRWFYERVGRITSSRSHQIAHLRELTDPSSLLTSIFGCSDRSAATPSGIPPVTAAPLSHGQDTEPIARREYIQLKKTQGTPVTVSLCGLFVSEAYPWLASSPDGLVLDESSDDKFGVLEIKCPFSSSPVRQLMKESSSFCLIDTEDGLKLKQTHPYFAQVQHHMAIVDRVWCDSFIYTQDVAAKSRSMEVVRVKQDSTFWSSHFLALQKFFFSVMIPDIISSISA